MNERKEVLTDPYINIKGIQILLKMPEKKARDLFLKISKEEDEELGEYRIHKNKVKTLNVLKSQKYSFKSILEMIELEEQIKNS